MPLRAPVVAGVMDASFHQLDDAKARAVHLLTCSLCTNQYTDPRVLPCQHTFCCRCLAAHIDRVARGGAGSTRPGAFRCPCCLADVGLPAAGAAAFPVDARIRNIRDLVVDEMAKDLRSRLKGGRDVPVCNGREEGPAGCRHGATRLDNISERPGVDDHVDGGTWPSSARHFHEDGGPDPAAFSHQRPGYSSVRGRTRRTRAGATPMNDNDAPSSSFSASTGGATSPDSEAARFGRERPGYSSMRGVPARTRSGTDDEPSSQRFDSIGRSRGRPASFYGNGRSSPHEPVRSTYQRAASHADVSSTSSPFDNINRDDDDAPYTPKIGRNRLAYSSLREMRRRPGFDPSQLFENPTTSSMHDDELSSPFGSGGFRGEGQRVGHDRHAAFQTHDTPEFSENLRREAFGESNRTAFTPPGANRSAENARDFRGFASDHGSSRGQKLQPGGSLERDSWQARTGGRDQCTGEAPLPDTEARFSRDRRGYSSMRGVPRTRQATHNEHPNSLDDDIGRSQGRNRTADKTRRQRCDGDDLPLLTVLSNLPADMKTAAKSRVSAASTSDHGQLHVDSQSNEVGHQTEAPQSPLPSLSCTQNDAASHTDSSKTDDVTSCFVDISKDSIVANADNHSPCSSHTLTHPSANKSAENVRNFAADKQSSSIEEGLYSPPRSPDESCFSRLTKFRSSKNSKQSASSTSSSAAESTTSKETDSRSSSAGDAGAGTVASSKSRARKRPPAFVGTPLSFGADGAATSPPSVVRNDDQNSRDQLTDTVQPIDSQNADDDRSTGADAEGGLCGRAAEDLESRASATAEASLPSPVDAVPGSCTAAAGDVSAQLNDDDSAMYSAVGVDSSDTSLRSAATEPCLPTPTTDDDDDVLDRCALDDEPVSAADDRPTHVIDSRPRDDVGGFAPSADSTAVDSNVEACRDVPVLINEAPSDGGTVEIADVEDDDDGVRPSACCSGPADELCHQNDEQGRTHSDLVNDGDVIRHDNNDATVAADLNVEGRQDGPTLIGGSSCGSGTDLENADSEERRASTCSDELHGSQEDDQGRTHSGHVNEGNITSTSKGYGGEESSGGGFRRSGCDMRTDEIADGGGYVLATGLAALGDGTLVVADYGAACVCLCDAEGRADHRVTGLKPFSVAAADDGLIYVGDRRRKTLVVLDRDGSDVAQWPEHLLDWVCGVAHLPDGHLAVLDRSRPRQLGIYPAAAAGGDGRPVAELGGHGSALGDLCMAEFATADSRGRVLVADSANHAVKAFDPRSPRPGVVAVYGGTRGSGAAQLQWPKGVAVDSADNVLVADRRNGRIVAFAADGRPLGSVVPAVRGPYAVCSLPATLAHRRRRLAVSSYSINGLAEFRLYDYSTDEIFV